jgi:glycosyltransferase involved in cell wall biosynthesis
VRVLYLIDSLIAGGGAERSLATLAPHYPPRGMTLDVAYFHERVGVAGELEAAGARLWPLTDARGLPGEARRAAELVRRLRPDVVHTTLFEADVAGRVAALGTRLPVVTSLVNTSYGAEQRANPALSAWKVRGAQLLDAVTARRVTRFHAVSSWVADVMAARLRVPRDHVDVIPRGRDAALLGRRDAARRAAARAGLRLRDDEPLVLAVGRHEYQKGYDVLLTAFARVRRDIPGARLAIAGRPTAETPALLAGADALGLGDRVDLLGIRDDVPELLCAADVFAFASRWEGMPGGVIEAMALEAPIVATGIAPVREVLGDDRCGWTVPVGDAEAMGAALIKAVCDPTAATRAAAARTRFLEHFTIERVADAMARFYERALG